MVSKAMSGAEPEFYSVTDAATVAGVSRMTIYRAAEQGELNTFRVGRKVLIKRTDFRAWIESKATGRGA
jgi:excisionase family DNA binding protein